MNIKSWLIAAFVFLQFTSCNSQEAKNVKKHENKPHESVQVNKKYDENGNLVAFDSVYTSYYSNIEGDTLHMDSLMDNFDMYFNNELGKDYSWNNLYAPDSTLNLNFFRDDFFEKQFLQQDEQMLKMMQQMDSLKNSFFKLHAQNLTL